MTGSSAADTWGISGPSFLMIFLVLLVASQAVVFVLRRVLAAGVTRTGWQPGPEELAYFNGGARQAIAAALAGLRTAEAITVQPGGGLVVVGSPPAAPSALTWAVYLAVQRGTRARTLHVDPTVRPALDVIRDTLIRNGWSLAPGRRRAIRLTALITVAVATLGFVRVAAGAANGKPVGFIVLLSVFALILAIVPLLGAPRNTPAGNRAMAAVRARNLHLSPASRPAMATYGASGAALAVGLYGVAAMWAADPALAAEANYLRSTVGGSTSSSWSGDSGGGDSGGCGGGCGGGGGGCGG